MAEENGGSGVAQSAVVEKRKQFKSLKIVQVGVDLYDVDSRGARRGRHRPTKSSRKRRRSSSSESDWQLSPSVSVFAYSFLRGTFHVNS